MTIFYTRDGLEIRAEIITDKSPAKIHEIIDMAACSWFIDRDGDDFDGTEFEPHDFIIPDLEAAGCELFNYSEIWR